MRYSEEDLLQILNFYEEFISEKIENNDFI